MSKQDDFDGVLLHKAVCHGGFEASSEELVGNPGQMVHYDTEVARSVGWRLCCAINTMRVVCCFVW